MRKYVLATSVAGSIILCTVAQAAINGSVDWRTYESNDRADHYSPASQIDKSNVRQLQEVWSYTLASGSSQTNPLVIDEVMYVVGSSGAIVALDAASGGELWSSAKSTVGGRPRGLMYWQSKDGADKRILFTTNDRLMEIDAATGKPILNFGVGGKVDLREGLGRPVEKVARIQSATPGRVFENLVILGSAPGEDYGGPPGHIRAYDVRTGKMVWIFHTIPQEGEFGSEQWHPEALKKGAAVNMWGGMSIDAKRGIAYIPLGSASYDFWGVDRPGSNLFANSLVALDARTGKRLWHFQTVHHDLWDYDLTTTPTLMTVKHNGKMVDIVVQAGKTGFLYVFDRVTGKPLWPIVERPVPGSDVPGEVASPTQPFPTVVPPFVRQTFTSDDVDPRMDPAEYAAIKARVNAARNDGIFTPPTIGREAVQMPGNHGGSNWSASGAEPRSGRYFVIGYDYPALLQLEKTSPTQSPADPQASPLAQGEAIYKRTCQSCHGAERPGPGQRPSAEGRGRSQVGGRAQGSGQRRSWQHARFRQQLAGCRHRQCGRLSKGCRARASNRGRASPDRRARANDGRDAADRRCAGGAI